MKIFYAKRAAKRLESLPREVQMRIAKKMRFYASEDNPLRFAKRLADNRGGEFRFRVGDYRLVFDVRNGAIYILKIGKRDEIYEL